jgi:hypothetical protein
MAACCLLMLVDKAAAPSDPRLIELLQKLKEPSRDRLLKVVFCTQVSPTATCNSVNRPSVRIEVIDARIKELGDWRGKMLSRLRTLVKEADPEVVEEWKWRGVPVWSHAGIICTSGRVCVPKIRFGNIGGEAHREPAVK